MKIQNQVRISKMRFYNSCNEAKSAISEVLSLDIRDGSARSNNKRLGKALDRVNEEFCIDFDNLKVSLHSVMQI